MKGSKLFLSIIFGIAVITAITVFYLYISLSFKNVNLFSSIPDGSVVSILKVKSFNHLKSTLSDTCPSKSGLFNNFLLQRSEEIFKSVENLIISNDSNADLSDFKNRSFLISSHLTNDTTLLFLYTFSVKNRLEVNLLLDYFKANNSVERENGDIEMYTFTSKSKLPLYFIVNEGILTLSYSKNLLLDSYNQQKSNKSVLINNQLRRLVEISKNSDFDNLYIYNRRFKDLGVKVLSEDWQEYLGLLQNNKLWTQYDVDYKQRELTLNGVFFNQPESKTDLLFKAGSSHCTLDRAYSADLTSFFNYSFEKSSFDSKFQQLLSLDDLDSLPFIKSWCSIIEPEFGVAIFNRDSVGNAQRAFFQRVLSSEKVIKSLESTFSIVENWKIDTSLNLAIYSFDSSTSLKSVYRSFFETIPTGYLISFDTYLVISDDIKLLKKIYLDYILGNTLSNNSIYREYRHNFPDNENIFIYSICKSGSFISKFLQKPALTSSGVNIFGAQLTYSDSVAYTSIVLDYDIKLRDFSNVKWRSFLDTIVATEPMIITNPSDNKNYILVQDAKDQLYLISDIGRILWKRPLDGRIMGTIQQFLIKGKAQNILLFNTVDKIYQVNIDGNNVGNFPVLLPSDATTSISLFDYEQNGDYRIFVPSKDKEIRVYDNKGNLVTGFQISPLSGEIYTPIQHFSVSGKDYIVLDDGYATRILDRKGKARITPSNEFDKSNDTPYYLISEGKQSYFVTSSKDGDILKISIPEGTVVKVQGSETSANHIMFPILKSKNSVNYLFISRERVKLVTSDGTAIYDNKIKFNDLFNVKLFGDLESGFFFSFLDRSSSLLYVYSVESGKLMTGFPKYGEQNYTLKLIKDGSLLIYSGTNHSSIISY